MKFEQMQYARPDFDAARETFASLRARIAAAPDAQAQLEAFREFETLSRHISTMSTLAEIRHTVDTRDAFYEAEREFFDANSPALGEAQLDVYRALLASPFPPRLTPLPAQRMTGGRTLPSMRRGPKLKTRSKMCSLFPQASISFA